MTAVANYVSDESTTNLSLKYTSSCDLDLDLDLNPMTLMYELDPDIVTISQPTENEEVSMRQGFQNLEHNQDRQTNRHTQTDPTKRITGRIRVW